MLGRARVGRVPYVCTRCRTATSAQSYSTAARRERPLRVAILGSGPAGFYSAYRLQKKLPDVRIDMYERLPVPFGLARFGVAPDHPEVKFIGNIQIGNDAGSLPLSAIAPHYDAVLFAYGASQDKKLGIPGEDLRGVMSARAFVGWYNGLPEHADLCPDLQAGETAVIIGQGNVALDVARILLAPLDELRKTDITEQAVEILSKSKVRDVKVIGRRGPLQAPYTIKEIREIMQMPGVGFAPPPESWESLMGVERKRLPRQLKRIAELLERGSTASVDQTPKAWQLGFLRSPAAFLSSDNINLEAVGFERTEYASPIASAISGDPQTDLNNVRAVRVQPTGDKTAIHASLAFRSVGYQSEGLPGMQEIGVPFDSARGIIPNDRWGRVISPAKGPAGPLTAGHVPGMYCAGWVKRGPTGVIASTLDDAFTTADILARDWQDGVDFNAGTGEAKGGWAEVKKMADERGLRQVSWQDWETIDAEERRRGKANGKEREKIRSVDDMLKVLDGPIHSAA